MARYVGSFTCRLLTPVLDSRASEMRVSLHTGPPHSQLSDCVREVSGINYTRGSSTAVRGWLDEATEVFSGLSRLIEDSWTDATPTGKGDPLAGVLRAIDELLEDE